MSSQTEPSWSRIATGDKAEGTFRVTIHKESVKSTSFRMKGPGDLETKWQLKIYPKDKECVRFSLLNESKFKVMAEYKMDIIDGAGKERNAIKRKAQEYDSGTQQGIIDWCKSKWLKPDRFNASTDLLPDGNLTLQCTITVFGAPKVLSGVDLDSSNPNLSLHCQKQLGEQLGKLFSEKQFTDIKIQCEGQTFDCHMAILAARSPVFMAMFQSNMKEKETNSVTIDDFKAQVVEDMLNYIYTGNISSQDTLSDTATKELLAAAVKYQLHLLRHICQERLCSALELTNCVEYLVLGDMYQTFKLKKMALRLVAENVDSISETDVIRDLFKQKPELALEVMKAVKKK